MADDGKDATTRNLDPTNLAFAYELMRGAFIILPPTTAKNLKSPVGDPQVLRFQFNPETITRTRTGAWDARKNSKITGPDVKAGSSASQQQEKNNFRGGGMFSKSETVAMKLVFDATELLLRDKATDKELGILPELAVLELIALGEVPKDEAKDAKKQAEQNKLNPVHPKELILVLGPRYFPVIVTQMTINEKRFNNLLVPIRAEVDLQMQVLEATEVDGDPAIRGAYNKLVGDRLENAKKAARNAKQGALGDFRSDQTAVALALRRTPDKGFGE